MWAFPYEYSEDGIVKIVSAHLELELQAIVSCPMWALRIELGCPGRKVLYTSLTIESSFHPYLQ